MADALPPFPLWGGDERFRAGLDALIGQPYLGPARFHPKALPIRRLVGVYGSSGVQKRAVITAYCATLPECPVVCVSVKSVGADDLEEARKQLDHILQPKESPYGVDAVIILNHAQRFQRDPHCLGWERKAGAANVVLFALLDCVPESGEFRGIFTKARLYLPPPGSAAVRVAQMRWHLAHYAAQCPEGAAQMQVTISDDEWLDIADNYTKLASPKHLKQFILRFIYEGHAQLTHELATGSPYVSYQGGDGSAHIVERSLASEENSYSEAAGLGPLLRVAPIQRRAKKQKIEEDIGAALMKKEPETLLP